MHYNGQRSSLFSLPLPQLCTSTAASLKSEPLLIRSVVLTLSPTWSCSKLVVPAKLGKSKLFMQGWPHELPCHRARGASLPGQQGGLPVPPPVAAKAVAPSAQQHRHPTEAGRKRGLVPDLSFKEQKSTDDNPRWTYRDESQCKKKIPS